MAWPANWLICTTAIADTLVISVNIAILGVLLFSRSQRGFTLIESLIVVVMMGILAAIALPTWLQFLANQRVDAARDEIRSGIQQAQTNAIAQRRAWQLSLRDHGDRLAWAVHPSSVTPASVTAWQTLDPQIVLNEANTRTEMQDQVHSIQFNFRGEEQRRSIITLEAKDGAAQMHCVSVATLLGRTTDGKERAQPNPFGFECY